MTAEFAARFIGCCPLASATTMSVGVGGRERISCELKGNLPRSSSTDEDSEFVSKNGRQFLTPLTAGATPSQRELRIVENDFVYIRKEGHQVELSDRSLARMRALTAHFKATG